MSRSTLSRAWPLVALAALSLAAGGCVVSKRRYDAMKYERDIYARQGASLTAEVDVLSDVAAAQEDELAIRDEEVEKLRQTESQLVDELQTFIVAGAIKIALMRDGLHLVLSEEVLFDSAQSELNDRGRDLIANLVDELKGFPYQIAVLGYTDNIPVGPSLRARYASNWELAANRAAAVVRLLEGAGISGDQLVVVSFGSNRPYVSNDTPEGRAENRRIEIRLRPVTAP